jgi:leader peptidase (prepilin peptidase)/N-methyltransferase
MLGRSVWIALMLALLLAVVPSVAMLARYGQRARKLAIPFAPFLAAGGLIALFAGPRLLDLYLRGLT